MWLKGFLKLPGGIPSHDTFKLYDTPFTVVDSDGLDGVFEDETEVNDLLEVVRRSELKTEHLDSTKPNERSQ